MGGSSSKYARGSRAWGLCQKCGLRFLLRTLLFDGYFPGLRVCAGCYDSKQPQEFLVDVTDPTTLYRPSPEFGPKPSVLVAMQVSNAIVLNWSETDPRGNARVKEYQVWQASSPYPDMFPPETLIATLPVEYYGDPGAPSLADLVENGSGRLGNTYDNEGIVEETLSYQDDSATSLNRYYKYSILALLQANPSDEYTMARSNEVIVQLLRPPSIESLTVGGDFLSGGFATIIPPFTGGTSLESLAMGGDFLAGSIDTVGACDVFFEDVVLLLHLDSDLTDSSGENQTVVYTGTPSLPSTFDTVDPMFGSAAWLSGANSNSVLHVDITAGNGTALNLANVDEWTIEGWIKALTTGNFNQSFMAFGQQTTNGVLLESQGLAPPFAADFGARIFGATTSPGERASVQTLQAGVWQHFALVKEFVNSTQSRFRMYLDGQGGDWTDPFTGPWVDWGQYITYGGTVDPTFPHFNGPNLNNDGMEFDELRVTSGVCRYRDNFTPEGPFPDTQCTPIPPVPEFIQVGPTKLMPVSAGMDGTRQHIPGFVTTLDANFLMFNVAIYGFVGIADPSVASITCAGLTFTLQSVSVGLSNPGGTESVRIEMWTAPLTVALTNEPFDIALTTGSDDACAMGVGFIGVGGFDAGSGTMPATDESLATGPVRTTGTTTVDTTNVEDLLLVAMVQNEVSAPITFNADYTPIFDCHIFAGARPIGMALAGYTPGRNLAGYVSTGTLVGGASLFGMISTALHG